MLITRLCNSSRFAAATGSIAARAMRATSGLSNTSDSRSGAPGRPRRLACASDQFADIIGFYVGGADAFTGATTSDIIIGPVNSPISSVGS